MTDSQARDRLLDAAVDHALTKGIVDLSLREIAAPRARHGWRCCSHQRVISVLDLSPVLARMLRT